MWHTAIVTRTASADAQRGRTINIPNGYFPIFCAILIYLTENEKRKLHYKIKHNRIIAIGYFVVIRTKSLVGNLLEICPRLRIEI